VHVPFCIHRCGYCDFTVIAGRDDLIPDYLRCLEQELQTKLGVPHPVETLFIGGGTPSHLPCADLQRLLDLLQNWLPLAPGGEFSVECNPDGLTDERIDVLRRHGVNRVSLGVQSFDTGELSVLERRHTPEEVAERVRQLRETGISSISLDLIFAVPGQSLVQWERTLQAALSLSPDHLSTYGLTYERGTAFWSRRRMQTLIPVPESVEREMYALAMTLLPEQGYEQYELSNFAAPGFRCRHNQVYWQAQPYWGFGPGAAEFVMGERRLNHRAVTTWLERVRTGQSPVQECETIDADLAAREAVMLGLRQIEGLSLGEFAGRHGHTVRDLSPESYDRFLRQGFLMVSDGQLRLTWEGRFLADSVVAEFL